MLAPLLAALEFRCNNGAYRPVMDAIGLLARYAGTDSDQKLYAASEKVPADGVVPKAWLDSVADEGGWVERIPYELCVLIALRDALRRREVYAQGAGHWKNPDEDLPGDFDDNRDVHYSELGKPLDATEFTDGLRRCLGDGLTRLDQSLAKGTAGGVRIITRQGSPWVSVPKRLPRGVRVHRAARLQALAAAEEHRRDPALRPGPGLAAWPRLEKILKKGPVNWELISRNYDCGAAIAGNGWFETDATVRSGEFKVFHPERTVALPFPVSRRLSGGWPVCACSVAGLPAREPADCRLARWKASSKTAEPAMADEPGGDVEEPVEGVNGEQAGGCPAAAQRPGDADHAGQDETL
jgi:hypothetical protein